MAYSTKLDILEEIDEITLIELTQDDPDGDEVVESKVTRAIENADSLIDGYSGKKYAIPLSPVPKLIRAISVDLAICSLYTGREGVPEDRQKACDNATQQLKDIAKGLLTLGVQPAPAVNTAQAAKNNSKTRIFDRDKMIGY